MQAHRRFEVVFFRQIFERERFGLGKRILPDIVFGRGEKHVAFARTEICVEIYVEVYGSPVRFPFRKIR